MFSKESKLDLSLPFLQPNYTSSVSLLMVCEYNSNVLTAMHTKSETFPFLLASLGVSCLSAQNVFMKPCFHELTMEYLIFSKIHLSRVFPLFISTVGMKILKEEFNSS
jgi:hypothetical protein